MQNQKSAKAKSAEIIHRGLQFSDISTKIRPDPFDDGFEL